MVCMRPPRIKKQTSAGGVVYRKKDGNIEVALIAIKDGTVWTLPKGLVEKDEHLTKTASREVREETGLDASVVAELGSISYWYYTRSSNTRYHKKVYYFLMEYRGGNTAEHDKEVKEARWFPIDRAIEIVCYPGDKHTLRKARRFLEDSEP